MQYHSYGYNLHDSWWRSDYGPGTQFPHADSSGNQSAFEGTHGCVNMLEENAHWLYDYVDLGTAVIIY
jgi:lipoprotein-anchoring transpeptidase ErfK/SrfK